MGNRAVITTADNFKNNGVGVYLHWNGGRDSVEAFLKYCDMQGYREPSEDCYGWAYLCGVISNFFSDGLSVGIDVIDHLDCDNGDNGVYIIEGWKIVDRKYNNTIESEDLNNYKPIKMIKEINDCMPERMKLDSSEIIHPFTNDGEKMVDFLRLSKEEFMMSYSYLTEEEYEATCDAIMRKIKDGE